MVPQDVEGLIKAIGGKAAFEAKLDQLLTTDSKLNGHEQLDVSGLTGQYAQGNEPSHHMAIYIILPMRPKKHSFTSTKF